MPNKMRLTTAALLLAILSGCGATRPAEPSGLLRLPPGKWAAKLTQSGGFASVLLTVEISSDGKILALDGRSGHRASETLPPDTMVELRRLIAVTPLSSIGTPAPSCLDCFVYEFELSSEAGTTRIHSDDATIDNSGAAALIRFIVRLRDAALNGRP